MSETGGVAVEGEDAPPTVGVLIGFAPESKPDGPPAPGAEPPVPGNANAAIEGFGC